MSFDLSHHGDADIVPGLVDLAVNVRSVGTPGWLAERIRATDLAAYPDPRAAIGAVAARHGRPPAEVLLTAGAAEAFVLLARALRPRRAVVVHPQFTEPEAALRAAGHQVDEVILPFPFTLDPALVPADADLVFVGNPTNPTSVAHPRSALLSLVRPGRIVVIDEAFADCLPGERESAAGLDDLTGLVVIRSLTKTWALAGLRVGYLLAPPDLVRLLAAAQPLWSVSAPALTACVATASAPALREAGQWAGDLAAERAHLLRGLATVRNVRVVPAAEASFALLDTPVADIRQRLLDRGFAVRRGETFPGLGPGWIRVAVRDTATSDRFVAALADAVGTTGQQPGCGARIDVMTTDDDVAKQISELEARRYQAMTDADTATLAGLFSARLVYTHSDASSDTKQSYLDRLASGDLDYDPIEHPESSIVVHGDCALVYGDMRGAVRIGGQPRVLNSKSLAVWGREDGSWVLLAFQPTKYPS